MDIRIAIIVGGESLQNQFDALSLNPDLIIATPGRLMHVLNETRIHLNTVQIIVYDEADRLFELGFAVQIREIQKRLSNEKQTLLFSATMPKNLAEFTAASLKEPQIIRLDSETTLSDKLSNQFILCRQEAKRGLLIYLLQKFIPAKEHCLIFVQTRHHVEYVSAILNDIGVSNVIVFGSMEQVTRNKNTQKFRKKQVRCMVVTDLAARGIDIPLLDNVINFNIPTKPKTFVHRVGRVARAGNSGTAWNLVDPTETPYMCDLFRFLNIPLRNKLDTENEEEYDSLNTFYGTIPRSLLEPSVQHIQKIHSLNFDIERTWDVCKNGDKMYKKCSSSASKVGVRQSRELETDIVHPMFDKVYTEDDRKCDEMIIDMHAFRPAQTIFEFSGKKTDAWKAMQETRRVQEKRKRTNDFVSGYIDEKTGTQEKKTEEEGPPSKKRKLDDKTLEKMKKKKKSFRDEKFFVNCEPQEDFEEEKLSIHGNMNEKLAKLLMTTNDDEMSAMMKKQRTQKWCPKKKKYVTKFLTDEVKNQYSNKNDKGKANDMRINKQKNYKMWQKFTKKRLGAAGEDEDSSSAHLGNNHKDLKSLGLKKFKHMKGSNEYEARKRFQSEHNKIEKIRKQRKLKEQRRERSRGKKGRGRGRGRGGFGGGSRKSGLGFKKGKR